MRLWLTGVCNLESIRCLWLRYDVAIQLAFLCLLASAIFPLLTPAQAPVFVISPEHSSIKVPCEGVSEYRRQIRQVECSFDICLP